MNAHLGPAATAFIDGELTHTRRDEVLAHLSHCASCRAEVAGLRRFKSALRGAAASPSVPAELTARLLAATERFPPASARPVVRPSSATGVRLRRHPRRPAASMPSRSRRTAVGGAFVALGLGGALSLAGAPPRGPVPPVDPTSSRFVLDHATTSNELPLHELDLVSVSSRSAATEP